MFHASWLRLIPLTLSLLFRLHTAAFAQNSYPVARSLPLKANSVDVDAYPSAVIDRPGILPPRGLLVTLEGRESEMGASLALNLGLGIARHWEMTGMISMNQSTLDESEIGLGRWLFSFGSVELDGRIVVPIYREGAVFKDVSLGPALSYTHDSRWVIAGLANLLHLTFTPNTHLDLPMEVSLGYQPWQRLFLFVATCLAEVGIHPADHSTFISKAAAEGGILFSQGRTYDFGIVASTPNAWKASSEWRVTILATIKKVR